MKEGLKLVSGQLGLPFQPQAISERLKVSNMLKAGWLIGRPDIKEESELERAASAALSGKQIPNSSQTSIILTKHRSDETFG